MMVVKDGDANMQLPLPAGSHKNPSKPTNNQICINYFPEQVGPSGRGATTLLTCAGNKLLIDLGEGEIRFNKQINNIRYVVCGDTFYSIDIDEIALSATSTVIGTLNTDSGPVNGINNPNQIMLVDGSYGYIYNYIFAGTVALGPIGGSNSDTYSLTINSVAVYTNQAVSTRLSPSVLVASINALSSTTGVTASYQSGLFTLKANPGITSITVTESGTGFTAGVDGITVSPGVFTSGLSFQQFQQITDPDFVAGTHVVYIDGYFISNQPNSQLFQFSQPNEGRVWDALDVAGAASKPDYTVGLAASKSELWVFGQNSIEVWDDTAAVSGAPFTKRLGSDIDIGCLAPYSITNINDLLVWIDSRGFIVQSNVSAMFRDQSTGFNLNKISDPDLDAELASYSTLTDAIGTTYVDRGHIMLEMTFPAAKKTWVYDFTTSLWHERNVINTELGTLEHSYNQYCDVANNLNICGGIRDGKIYILDSEYYYDNTLPIIRQFSSYHITNDFKQIGVDCLELKVDTGHAEFDQDINQCMMQFSNDSGYSWSYEVMRPLGKHGQYNRRIIWNMLGSSYEWMFLFKITAPFKHSVVDLSINSNIEA